jgi:hypothetical protein
LSTRILAIGFIAGCVLGAALWPGYGPQAIATLAPAWQMNDDSASLPAATTVEIDAAGRILVKQIVRPLATRAGAVHPVVVAADMLGLSLLALLAAPGKVLRTG